jgi:DNA-binding CsgD family transcriptional regulator
VSLEQLPIFHTTQDRSARAAIPLVGRGEELRILDSVLLGTAPASVILKGEAGMGKSCLVRAFSERASRLGFVTAVGHCYPLGDPIPYLPIQQWLRQLGLGGIEDLRASNPGIVGPSEVGAWRLRFLRALTDTLGRGGSSRKLLLVVEDLQHADEGSLIALNHLLDMSQPWLRLLCTARHEAMHRLLEEVERKSHRLDLRPLTARDVTRLTDVICAPDRLSESENAFLWQLSGGSPFIAEELAVHLKRSGMLQRHDAKRVISIRGLPSSVQDAVDLQLKLLSPESMDVLSHAAAIEVGFPSWFLAEMLQVTESAIETYLWQLVELGVLERDRQSDERQWVFRSPLVRQSIYERCLETQKQRVHHLIAEAARAHDGFLSTEEYARHLVLAKRESLCQEEVDACVAAAESAERLLDYELAIRRLTTALNAVPTNEITRRAAILFKIGLSLRASGKWADAMEKMESAYECYLGNDDLESAADVALALGETLHWKSNLHEASRWLEHSVELAPSNCERRIRALAILGSARCALDDYGRGVALLEEALGTGQSLNTFPEAAFWLSHGLILSGDYSRAKSVGLQGLRQAQQLGDHRLTSLLASSLAQMEMCRLRSSQAATYVRIVASEQQYPDSSSAARAFLTQAILLGYRGRWRAVRELTEKWSGDLRLAGRFQVATANVIAAEALSNIGLPLEARATLQDSLRYLGGQEALASTHLARILLKLGDEAEASDLIETHSDYILSSARTRVAKIRLAELAACLPDSAIIEASLSAISSEKSPMLVGYSPISVERVRACLLGSIGQWDESLQSFQRAANQLSAGRAWWELGLTLIDYVEAIRLSKRMKSSEGDNIRRQGRRLFSRLGLPLPESLLSKPWKYKDGFGLSRREIQVLSLVGQGKKNQEIAEELTVTPHTVYRHMESIFNKMGVSNRTQAVIAAFEAGLLHSP